MHHMKLVLLFSSFAPIEQDHESMMSYYALLYSPLYASKENIEVSIVQTPWMNRKGNY